MVTYKKRATGFQSRALPLILMVSVLKCHSQLNPLGTTDVRSGVPQPMFFQPRKDFPCQKKTKLLHTGFSV
jgi:hypothetical protein